MDNERKQEPQVQVVVHENFRQCQLKYGWLLLMSMLFVYRLSLSGKTKSLWEKFHFRLYLLLISKKRILVHLWVLLILECFSVEDP